jgi:hypothetical protein
MVSKRDKNPGLMPVVHTLSQTRSADALRAKVFQESCLLNRRSQKDLRFDFNAFEGLKQFSINGMQVNSFNSDRRPQVRISEQKLPLLKGNLQTAIKKIEFNGTFGLV